MKLASGKVQSFVASYAAKPDPSLRFILVYGPDHGLVAERAALMARAIVSDLDDPFRVATLAPQALAQDPALFADELAAQSLMGGRRVIRIRDAGDGVAKTFVDTLKSPPPGDTVAVVEAGDLPARSALRRAFESASSAVAIPCYADSVRDLAELIKSVFARYRIQIAPDAQQYLIANLGSDHGLSRAELEKLALYAGDGARVTLEDAQNCIGDSALISAEDAIFAAASGNAAMVDRALCRAFEEGQSAIGILRMAQRHFDRLHHTGARVEAGESEEEAMRQLRPPLFFKQQEEFLAQLRRWPRRRAAAALSLLLEAERNSKRTGFPAETLCSEVLLRLARSAERKR